MATTLVGSLNDVTAQSLAPVRFFDADGVNDETTWAGIHAGAQRLAGGLQAWGVLPGDRVGVLGFTSRPVVETVFGVLMAGATVVMLPLPMRLAGPEAFLAQTRRRLAASRARLLVVDDFFAAQYEPGPGAPTMVTTTALSAGGAAFETVPVHGGDLAVLQFTSGSTAEPRAVRLPHASISANVAAITGAAEVDPATDSVASWLPLYHDMGLIGMLFTTAVTGMTLSVCPPQAFLSRPPMWMEAVSEFRTSLITGPNFAYALATRRLSRSSDLDLSCLRLALNGAEPVNTDTFDAFVEAGAAHGMSRSVPLCVYGLAEATLAVTFPLPGSGLRVDAVDRHVLEADHSAVPARSPEGAKRLAGLGLPLRGVAVRVVDDAGREVGERQVGEVLVAGSSLMEGYDGHPDATAAVLSDGWLHTGDYGYTAGGDLFVCGRKKDLIIVGGRNVWPEDVEAAAHTVAGVRPGNAIAFAVENPRAREALVLVAETRMDDTPSAEAIARTIALTVKAEIGLAPRQVLLVPPGELPKTSSGKLQRNLCRSRYLDGDIAVVATHGRL